MKLLLAVAAGQVCHCRSSGLTRLAEADVGLGDQDLDRRQLRDGLGRRGRAVRAARQIGGNAAGTQRNGQDDDTCGIHTRYSPLSRREAFGHAAASIPSRQAGLSCKGIRELAWRNPRARRIVAMVNGWLSVSCESQRSCRGISVFPRSLCSATRARAAFERRNGGRSWLMNDAARALRATRSLAAPQNRVRDRP